MEMAVNNTVITLPPDREPMCNDDVLRFLADRCGHTVSEMVSHFRVTQTAIRARLRRLIGEQTITRQRRDDAARKRGRPQYLYYITSRGETRLAEGDPRPMPAQE
jgi:predicted ArsR family transcriptional regulator